MIINCVFYGKMLLVMHLCPAWGSCPLKKGTKKDCPTLVVINVNRKEKNIANLNKNLTSDEFFQN